MLGNVFLWYNTGAPQWGRLNMEKATFWCCTSENNEPAPAEAARISPLDRGYFGGESVYETLRTYHAKPFALDDHLRRLWSGLERAGMPLPNREDLKSAINSLAKIRAPEESYLRVNVSAGLMTPGQAFAREATPRWVAFSAPLPPHVAAVYERGVRCIVSSRPRFNPGGFVPAVKFSFNAEIIFARAETARSGAYEALLLSPQGFVAEASSSNLFLVFGKKVVTPDLATGILDGVTRAKVLSLCPKAGLEVEERRVLPEELFKAGELFLTGTTREVVPVVSLGGQLIGRGEPGIVTDRLLGLFQELALESTAGGDY